MPHNRIYLTGHARRYARLVVAGIIAIVWTLGVAASPDSATVLAAQTEIENPSSSLLPVVPDFDYAAWYAEQTIYTGVESTFGVWAVEAVNDDLYIAIGTGLPATNNGALFASISITDTVTAISELDEQGDLDMISDGDWIFIPGVDPVESVVEPAHEWDWGNVYTYDTDSDTFTKYRNLPNVIHTWGLWYNSSADVLYAAASSHQGDYVTWTGEVYKSVDKGANWTLLADWQDGVGFYRTWDILGFNQKLYALRANGYGVPCRIVESSDLSGTTWSLLPQFSAGVTCYARLFTFDDKLFVLDAERDGLYTMDTDGNTTHYPFPGFKLWTYPFRFITRDASGNYYVFTEDGRIERSADLITWTTMASTDRLFISIQQGSSANSLVVTDRGRDVAGIWEMDLATAQPISVLDSPVLSIVHNGGDAVLDWPDIPGAVSYRVYSHSSRTDLSTILHRVHTTEASTWPISPEVMATDPSYFTVRAVAATDDVSPPSNQVGSYSFSLSTNISEQLPLRVEGGAVIGNEEIERGELGE